MTPPIPPSSSAPFLSFIHPSCGVVSLASLSASSCCAVHSCRAAPLGSNEEIGSHTNAVVLSQQQAAISAHDLFACHNGALASKKKRWGCWCMLFCFLSVPSPTKLYTRLSLILQTNPPQGSDYFARSQEGEGGREKREGVVG